MLSANQRTGPCRDAFWVPDLIDGLGPPKAGGSHPRKLPRGSGGDIATQTSNPEPIGRHLPKFGVLLAFRGHAVARAYEHEISKSGLYTPRHGPPL